MKVKNVDEILAHCLEFGYQDFGFGFGFKPDFYNKFDWIEDPRLERYLASHSKEIGLVRLGGDVGLHRDKDVSSVAKIVVLRDFKFEIDGEIKYLESGDIFEFKAQLPHRGWNVYCLVMWNKKKSR